VSGCESHGELIGGYVLGALDPAEMEAMRRHLEKCAGCYPYLDFERAFLDALAGCKETRCAPEKLKAKILSKLREAGYSGVA